MTQSPILGVLYHWLGGLSSASNFIPFRRIKRWSFEIYWIVQGVAAWLLCPPIIAAIFIPHPLQILSNAPAQAIHASIFWGALWGIGGLTFGLSVRYLGIALGYAIALGFCTACGTLIPPIVHGQLTTLLHTKSGQATLTGIAICLAAIAVNGLAGHSKEKEVTREDLAASGERDYNFTKGLAVAIFAGLMSSCFAFGLDSGKPIADLTAQQLTATHRSPLWQNLPVLVIVLWGGFTTNLIWAIFMVLKNKSAHQLLGSPGSNPLGNTPTIGTTIYFDPRTILQRLTTAALLKNYALAASAGILWYFQFFFYSMGEASLAKYGFASWALHMASIILFATLWGVALKEWRGVSRRTTALLLTGLTLLIVSTVVIGWGEYLAFARAH